MTFYVFGNKMINIVLYGSYLWVLLTCYPNLMKSELLCDVKEVWGGKDRLYCLFSNLIFQSKVSKICTKESLIKASGTSPAQSEGFTRITGTILWRKCLYSLAACLPVVNFLSARTIFFSMGSTGYSICCLIGGIN